ncbi:sulfotransferase 1C4-like [Macrobrachium rosenbergii]|uniref:sulfotransferase 1C4-like n=1 Tax=Macrobrachium rosenbergii TaxID=79674 RepID=UPI0034D3D771
MTEETRLASGHLGRLLQGQEAEDQKRKWRGITSGLVRLHPDRWLYPADYLRFANSIYNFKFRADDVLLMTWPKCGTTWMQEITWTMRNNPDLDNPEQYKAINIRVPFLDCDMFLRSELLPPPDEDSSAAKDFSRLCPGRDPGDGFFLQLSEAIPKPRALKTHLPFSLFEPSLIDTSKVIYMARHPKDVVVSYYHHVQLFKSMSYSGTFNQFFEAFINDDLVYGPYWLHVKEAWEKRDHDNLHFIFYEDLKADPLLELKKLDTFLCTGLSADQLEKICHYTHFDQMKQRNNPWQDSGKKDNVSNEDFVKEHGGFFRKGESNTWESRLTPEQSQKVDDWITKNLTPLGIEFTEG